VYTPIRLLIISIVLAFSQSTSLFAQDLATVIRVIDGDTLKISYEGQEERLGLSA
jgi:endonuclease YncB( thermonuclease family)